MRHPVYVDFREAFPVLLMFSHHTATGQQLRLGLLHLVHFFSKKFHAYFWPVGRASRTNEVLINLTSK